MSDIICILAFVGAGFIVSVVICFIILFRDWLTDQIYIAKYNYKKKHRFDGPPTAKCYCKDCVSNTLGEYPGCTLNDHKYVEDDFFCKKAEPRKRDPEKKK